MQKTIKRVALVASAALAFAGISGVAAHAFTTQQASGWNINGVYSNSTGTFTTGASTSVTAVANTIATAQFQVQGGPSQVNVSISGVGQFTGSSTSVTTGASDTTTAVTAIDAIGSSTTAPTFPTSQVTFNQGTTSSVVYSGQLSVYSQVAGTSTLTAVNASTGATIATATITWTATSGTGVNVAHSSIYFVSGTTCATPGSSKTADSVAIANDSSVITNAAAGTAIDVCVISRDANDNAIPLQSATIVNSVGGTASTVYGQNGSYQQGTALSSGATNYLAIANVSESSSISGNATYTAILTDYLGNVVTLTAPFTYYGAVASLKLVNYSYAAQYGGTAISGASTAPAGGSSTPSNVGKVGTATSPYGVIQLIGLDANGATVNLSSVTSSTLPSNSITVQSDYTTTAVAAGSSNSAGAVVNFGTDSNANTQAEWGFENGELVVNCSASTKPEHLKITVNAVNSSSVAISSNTVDFYCSNTPASNAGITVTPSATTVADGGIASVTAKVVDASGYPVPDGTSVTYAVSGDGTVAPTTSATSNGVAGTSATTVANFVAGASDGTANVTAIAGNYANSASITVGTGTDANDQASLATDAANAATDAANAAAASADNATQAASDALAAVQALDAKVTSLISSLQKQIAALAKKIK